MSALICDRCGQEIVAGSLVEFIGGPDPEESRIVIEGESLVVHATCPEPYPTIQS